MFPTHYDQSANKTIHIWYKVINNQRNLHHVTIYVVTNRSTRHIQSFTFLKSRACKDNEKN